MFICASVPDLHTRVRYRTLFTRRIRFASRNVRAVILCFPFGTRTSAQTDPNSSENTKRRLTTDAITRSVNESMIITQREYYGNAIYYYVTVYNVYNNTNVEPLRWYSTRATRRDKDGLHVYNDKCIVQLVRRYECKRNSLFFYYISAIEKFKFTVSTVCPFLPSVYANQCEVNLDLLGLRYCLYKFFISANTIFIFPKDVFLFVELVCHTTTSRIVKGDIRKGKCQNYNFVKIELNLITWIFS